MLGEEFQVHQFPDIMENGVHPEFPAVQKWFELTGKVFCGKSGIVGMIPYPVECPGISGGECIENEYGDGDPVDFIDAEVRHSEINVLHFTGNAVIG